MISKHIKCFNVVVASVFVTGISAYASISINLQRSLAIQYPSGTSLPAGALVQLIWSPDNAYETSGTDQNNMLNLNNITHTAGSQYGAQNGANTDYLLFETTTPSNGGWGSADLDGANVYQNSLVNNQTIQNGYLYVYIFQDGTPNGNDYYARSAIYGGLSNHDGSPTPPDDAVNASPSSQRTILGTTASGGQGLQVQAVPEPATIGLFAFGLIPLALRRRFRKA